MINGIIIKIIRSIDNLIEAIKQKDSEIYLLSSVLKIKKISKSNISEEDKILEIKDKIKTEDIFNLYYIIEDPIEILEESLIAQNSSIVNKISIKSFENITNEEKKKRIGFISDNFNNLINKGKNLTDIINLVAEPIKEEFRTEYSSSLDLPFSNKTLFLKVGKDGIIYFSLDKDTPWLIWEGSNFCYNVLKQNRFKPTSKWYIKNELELIDKYIEIFYTSSLHYFKNVK